MERRAAMAEQLINGQVIEACQQGDRDAFQSLFEAYKDKVFSIAVYSSGGDRTLAEDVTQQIFLKLFTAIRQFRGDSEFTTWLYRLVVNACLDERRRRRRWLPWDSTQATTIAMNNVSDKKPQERQYARLEVAEVPRDVVVIVQAVDEQEIDRFVPGHIVRVLQHRFDGIGHADSWSIGTVPGRSKTDGLTFG